MLHAVHLHHIFANFYVKYKTMLIPHLVSIAMFVFFNCRFDFLNCKNFETKKLFGSVSIRIVINFFERPLCLFLGSTVYIQVLRYNYFSSSNYV
jgi:hypothetical protein